MPTIGVSVAVPEPFGSWLQDYRVSLGEESARLIPTHVTLVSPYELDEAALPAVRTHLAEVAGRHAPFGIHLRGTGSFLPTSPVVFVGVVEGISACERLSAELRTGPLQASLAFPYHPHVTVAHRLSPEALDRAFTELAGYDEQFDVTEFWLYSNDETAGWQPLEAYQLGGPAA